MKKLFAVCLLSLSTIAFAEVPSIKAYESSCQELQDFVANYREVMITEKAKFLGIKSKSYVTSEKRQCAKKSALFKYEARTTDQSKCFAGYVCVPMSFDVRY